mgnify:CR=1 FL=1
MNFRQKLRKNKTIRSLSSVKLAVVCLILLFILTYWGTIAQVHQGLYIAQERFFESFFFLVLGFIPFPGAQLVMWVLFVNLACVALTRLIYKWRNTGIIIIHFGLMLFLISGYIVLHGSQESSLTLYEGQSSNVSRAYHDWEIAVWEAGKDENSLRYTRKVTAIDAGGLRTAQDINFSQLGFQLTVKNFYRNCLAYAGPVDARKILNTSGIQRLQQADLEKEPEKNIPGGIFTIQPKEGKKFDLLLYGNEDVPFSFKAGGKNYAIMLRQARYPLPFQLKLIDFMMEQYPGTDTPRSFKSQVAINTNNAWREKLISMNNPLRDKEFTLYQSSYQIDKMGNEASTLAVVKNRGRILPYAATFVTFAGLVIHFIMMAFTSKRKFESPYVDEGK